MNEWPLRKTFDQAQAQVEGGPLEVYVEVLPYDSTLPSYYGCVTQSHNISQLKAFARMFHVWAADTVSQQHAGDRVMT